MASEKFCLRWNDFEANISSAFREIRDDKEFFDVTLASEDENQIQAHKVIIGACSPFFRNILRKNSHNHPLLYLKGVKYKELVSVLNFMYHGEVNVAQDDLNSFLAVAEELRVKGLTQGQGGSKGEPQKTEAAKTVPIRPRDEPAPKRSRPNPTPPQVQSAQGSSLFSTYQDDDITEVVPVKSEPGTSQMAGQVDNAVALEEQQQYDESYDYGQYEEGYDDGTGAMVDPNTGMPIQAGDGNKDMPVRTKSEADVEINSLMFSSFDEEGKKIWVCGVCNFIHVKRDKLHRHVDKEHYHYSYSCELCGRIVPTQNALMTHINNKHRENK